jgi:hypothetical protein
VPSEKRPWVRIKEFPDYVISREGVIRKPGMDNYEVRRDPSGRSVKLKKDGKQYMRSVRVLVEKTFPSTKR